jgi:hypothetical protein
MFHQFNGLIDLTSWLRFQVVGGSTPLRPLMQPRYEIALQPRLPDFVSHVSQLTLPSKSRSRVLPLPTTPAGTSNSAIVAFQSGTTFPHHRVPFKIDDQITAFARFQDRLRESAEGVETDVQSISRTIVRMPSRQRLWCESVLPFSA